MSTRKNTPRLLHAVVGRLERLASELEKTNTMRWDVLTDDSGLGGDYVHYRRGTLAERFTVAWRNSRSTNIKLNLA